MATALSGYDYTFVDSNDRDKYLCAICLCVARNPYQANCCASVYCKSCLEHLQRAAKYLQCPNCRASLNGKCFYDGIVHRSIRSLKVYCTNNKKGCKWTGELRSLDHHLDKCQHMMVVCTNEWCYKKVKQSKLNWHLTSECFFRRCQCPHCLAEGVHVFITGDHLYKCPDLPLPCPIAGCNKTVKRHMLAEHRKKCPHQLVSCSYKIIGCDLKVKLGNLEAHNQVYTDCHLTLATKAILTQDKHITTQDKHITYLYDQIERSKISTCKLEKKIEHELCIYFFIILFSLILLYF